MLKYRVIVEIEKEIESEWLKWMTEVHIPEVLATGLIDKAELLRNIEYDAGQIYVADYTINNNENYHQYLEEFAPGLRTKAEIRFCGRYHPRREVFEVVELFDSVR